MKLLYIYKMDFPNNKAHSVQIANTCHALARLGIDVSLVVDRMTKDSLTACMDFYGLDVPKTLTIHVLGHRPWIRKHKKLDQYLFFRHVHRLCSALHGRDDVFVYSRDRRGLKVLRQLLQGTGWPYGIFEAHKLEHKTLLDRPAIRDKSADPKATHRKVSNIRRLEETVYSTVQSIVCNSEGTMHDIVQDFSPTCPIRVIPNGVAERAPRAILRDLDILYCGQLYAWKGIDTLIEAMQFLPEYRLTIVGGNNCDDLRRIQKLAERLHVSYRINFIGHVPPPQALEYLDRACIGVVPLTGSAIEDKYTCPIKLFDYMMSRVPVVASALPSIREHIQNGHTGTLVSPNCSKALATGIRAALGSVNTARVMAERAYKYVQTFTWEKRAQKILELFELRRRI